VSAFGIFETLTFGPSLSQLRIGMSETSLMPFRSASSHRWFRCRSVHPTTSLRLHGLLSQYHCHASASCRSSSTALPFSSIGIYLAVAIGIIPLHTSVPAMLSCTCCGSSTSTRLAVATTSIWRWSCMPHRRILRSSAEQHLSSSVMQRFCSVRQRPNETAIALSGARLRWRESSCGSPRVALMPSIPARPKLPAISDTAADRLHRLLVFNSFR